MQNFERENRYLVIKGTDAENSLNTVELRDLLYMVKKVNRGREESGKEPFSAVVVEHDWPEYNTVWSLIEERVKHENRDGLPQIGSIWEHKNGNLYRVLLVTNTESTNKKYPVTIVYRGANGNLWTKSLDKFLEKMVQVQEKP